MTPRDGRALRIPGAKLQAAALVLLSALAAGACNSSEAPGQPPPMTGNVSGSGGTSVSGGGAGAGAGSTAAGGTGSPTCLSPAPGAAPIRRLTRFEYNNTVRDLLFDTSNPGDSLPPEIKGNGFSNDAASLTTTPALVDAYHSVAGVLARKVTSDSAKLAKLSACDVAAQGEETCAKNFITDFGAKAFRRKLGDAESAALYAVYQAGKEGTGHVDGLRAVLEMVLQSPQFLYRVELGTAVAGQGLLRPTSVEMATRLSYLLWGSTPDSALMTAAAAGQLETKEQIRTQAELMLKDPRAREIVRYFTGTLYGIRGLDALDRTAALFPTFTRGMGALFRKETERFIDEVVWNGAGDFGTLFNADYTFVNGPLATFYGIAGITGDEFQRVSLDPARRRGLLTHASILAGTTPGSSNDPVVRGKFVFEELFCGHVPSPPVGLMVKPPPADPTRTTRERFAAHREQEPCKGCHVMLDPIGYGLENFDGVGLWRDTENGKPVDASGALPPNVDTGGPFVGPTELAQKIASSEDARSCFASKWLSYAYGRSGSEADACTRAQLEEAFRASGGSVQALLLAATQTDAFLYLPAPTP